MGFEGISIKYQWHTIRRLPFKIQRPSDAVHSSPSMAQVPTGRKASGELAMAASAMYDTVHIGGLPPGEMLHRIETSRISELTELRIARHQRGSHQGDFWAVRSDPCSEGSRDSAWPGADALERRPLSKASQAFLSDRRPQEPFANRAGYHG